MTGSRPRSAVSITPIRRQLWVAAAFSVVINALFLVSPLYMLQVYDRVLTSGSVATLIYLTVLAVFLMAVFVAADAGRKRVLGVAGERLGRLLDERTLCRGLERPDASPNEVMQATKDLTRVQSLIGNATVAPLFDLPFTPLFLLLLFFVHPILGVIGLVGAGIEVALAILTATISDEGLGDAGNAEQEASRHLAGSLGQRSAVIAMGMGSRLTRQWTDRRRHASDAALRAGRPVAFMASTTRAVRMTLQIFILGAAAWLAIQGAVTAGTVVAGSIILGRALAPIDQLVASWRNLSAGRQSWRRLQAWLGDAPLTASAEPIAPMPRPAPQVTFEAADIGLPGSDQPLIGHIDQRLPRGSIVAILGRSGCGKSTLLQSIAGVYPLHGGKLLLGERDMATWPAEDRGQHVGYLPQDVDLLSGSVLDNIARFEGDAAYASAVAIAEELGFHERFLNLPQAYETMISAASPLSAGQRQIIGLARAFRNHPPLILLDEPTAHLDRAAATSLVSLLMNLARKPAEERSSTILIATHDIRLINAVDIVMQIENRSLQLATKTDYVKQLAELSALAREAGPGKPSDGRLTVTLEKGSVA